MGNPTGLGSMLPIGADSGYTCIHPAISFMVLLICASIPSEIERSTVISETPSAVPMMAIMAITFRLKALRMEYLSTFSLALNRNLYHRVSLFALINIITISWTVTYVI